MPEKEKNSMIIAELMQIESESFALTARCQEALKRIRLCIAHIEKLEGEWENDMS